MTLKIGPTVAGVQSYTTEDPESVASNIKVSPRQRVVSAGPMLNAPKSNTSRTIAVSTVHTPLSAVNT